MNRVLVDIDLLPQILGAHCETAIIVRLSQDGGLWEIQVDQVSPDKADAWDTVSAHSSRWSQRRDPCTYRGLSAEFGQGSVLLVSLDSVADCQSQVAFDLETGAIQNAHAERDRQAAIKAKEQAEKVVPVAQSGKEELGKALELLQSALFASHALEGSDLADIHWQSFRVSWALSEIPSLSEGDRVSYQKAACGELRFAVSAGHEDEKQWLHTVCAAVWARP